MHNHVTEAVRDRWRALNPSAHEHRVFILGAGASRSAGTPLMGDFLAAAQACLHLPPHDTFNRPAFERVFLRFLPALQVVHSKAQLDIHNIEQVFAAFEMANLFGHLGRLQLTEEERGQITADIRTVIVQTLERTTRFLKWRPSPDLVVAGDYMRFAEYLRKLIDGRGIQPSIITFNYDVAFDYALWAAGLRPLYGFETQPDERRTEDALPIDLLKLHGSLNFRICELCDDRRTVNVYKAALASVGEDSEVRVPIGSAAVRCDTAACQGATMVPMIVPPTWSKTDKMNAMQVLWSRAAGCLASAHDIRIAGYSWPQSDQFFAHLFALGSSSDTILRRIEIVDPAAGTIERFTTSLFGQQANRVLHDREPREFRHAVQAWIGEDNTSYSWESI